MSPDNVLTLAVYHRGDDIEQHIAALRPVSGLRLELVRKGSLWTVPSDVSGVLWELSPEDGAHRLVSALVSHVPAASFSASTHPSLIDLSRALGFREHLPVPLRVSDVERALGLRQAIDLADRVEIGGPRLLQLAQQTDTFGALVRSVNVSLEPGEVATALAAAAMDWMPLQAYHVIALDPDGTLRTLGDPPAETGLKSAIESFADVIVKTGQSAVRVTNYVDDRVAGEARQAAVEVSALGWPLVAHGSVIGALIGIDLSRARRLPSLSESLSASIAKLLEPAAFALANALRVARAEALSVTDDLTQLYNSRFLNDALRKEAKRAMRSGWPLSLLFIDLDGFKRINDAYGHLLGSRALVEAAEIIRTSARETDLVARFGGDEFAILLPETGSEGAQMVARRLRERVSRYVFLAESTSGSRLTASIGVATMPDAADTAERLLQAADAAMYRVKVTGKNGIHVAGSETESAPLSEAEQELP